MNTALNTKSTRRSLKYFSHPLSTVAQRDLLLLENLNLKSTDRVLEVEVGSGSSLLQLAGTVATLHGVDIASQPVERLRRIFSTQGIAEYRLALFTLDFCRPDAATRLPTRYDLIFSCDTLEHVSDPQAFFINLYKALRPGGRLFLTFPNESPQTAHGITFFESPKLLQQLLLSAGFPEDGIEIGTIQLSPPSKIILDLGWSYPRHLAKRILHRVGRRGGAAATRPQTFDETDFFRTADRLEPVAPVINAYCWE